MPGMFTSAVSIFSMGTSFKWVRDNICSDLIEKANIDRHLDVYDLMTELAAESPVGSNNLLLTPVWQAAHRRTIASVFVALIWDWI